MTDTADLLVELGTEELPPASLKSLADAFAGEVLRQIDEAELAHGELEVFATPRRLAFRINALQTKQQDRQIERRGPAVQAAFDEQGAPTRAAQGFAQSVGLKVEDLGRLETGKGTWLSAQITEKGRELDEMLPEFLARSVQQLPIAKRMRWGRRKARFVRPAHWLVVLLDERIVDMRLLELSASRVSRGHRFHAPGSLSLAHAREYEQRLEDEGHVLVDHDRRRETIREQVLAAGKKAGGSASIDPALLEEVTALVEWPVALAGRFSEDFLRVPQEALIYAMQEHQKYFPVLDENGRLLNAFITVSNIESRDPRAVIHGNERVIRPRLADAAFFYDNDCRKPLAEHARRLEGVVFQEKLGTVADKCARIAHLAEQVSAKIGGDPALARQAGELCKADLSTEMVDEFASMQGIMGYYLARNDNLDEEVARAMPEHYLPRFATDELPATPTGQAVALADRIDTLVGIFGIGQTPTGDKDPYALRRAALGILRILIEKELGLNLRELLTRAAEQLGDRLDGAAVESAMDFIQGRYRAFYQDRDVPAPVILSVLAVAPDAPLDFDRRIHAVEKFRQRAEAEALAAANKRVANILAKQGGDAIPNNVDPKLLQEREEKALNDVIGQVEKKTAPLAEQGDYGAVLEALAGLREPVDRFFDAVMVMAEDEALRNNRLALLDRLRRLFLQVADISELG